MSRAALLVIAACLLFTSPAHAQRAVDSRVGATLVQPAPADVAARPMEPVRAPFGEMTGLGAAFAAGGLFAGAVLGARVACGDTPDDWCDLGGALIGATVGEVVMLPLGVHLASGRTSYGRKLLVSSGVMLGGLVLAPVTAGASLLAVPPVQLLVISRMEGRRYASPAAGGRSR